MYTAKELIEVLKQCPEDYIIFMDIRPDDSGSYNIDRIFIDHTYKEVDLIAD